MSHEQLIKADDPHGGSGVPGTLSKCIPASGPPVLVSACLVGLATRYDGKSKQNPLCLAALDGRQWVPVCPEQLGGLPTPREPAFLGSKDGAAVLDGSHRVLTATGRDVSDYFIRGAHAILEIGRLLHAEEAFLKADSPSCGWGKIKGVAATLLAKEGFEIREF